MIISAVNLDSLDEEDIEEIAKKFERDEEDFSGEEEIPAEEPEMEDEEIPSEDDLSEMDAMDALESFIDTPIENNEIEKYGFTSLEEFNAMRLQDHSLKIFFEQAKKSPYFSRTLFVIYGDHGVSTKVSDHMPAGYIKNDLTSYHVPLLFYAPTILTPKLDTRVVSQVDIMPTVASLLGVPYKIKTIGRDLFDSKYDQERFAFFYSWFADPPKYGLISSDYIFIQHANQSALYNYKDKNHEEDLSQKEPVIFKKMQELTQGIYETSRYMMHYNQRIQEK
jgi:phosphoglycerol transferase MdoB-like AlkP superfamily enzyme